SARLSRLRVEALDGQHGPELANRFFDVVTLQKAASSLLLEGLAAVLQAAVGALLLAFYHPALLAFDAVAMGLVALALVPTGRGAVRTAVVESKRKYAVAAWLEELAGRPLALRGGQLADVRTDQLANAWLTAREDHFRVVFRQYVAMQAVAVLVPVLLLVLAGWLVLEGGLTLGQLVAAEFVVTASLAGIVKLSGKLETVYDLLAGVDKLGHLLDLPIDAPRGVALDREGPARVELDGVSVGAGGPDVLSGLTLQLEPGQRRSIVGPAGSGKTLLGEVIVGARRPTAGAAILDGVPMASIRPRVLGRQTLLLRGQAAFAGTLRDNLTLGNRVPDESLWLALEAAGLAPIARRLPDGLDSELLPDGRPLGAGSQAALGVARALVCAPRLLVVDGLLDGLCPTDRARLAGLLLDPARPWTLVVLTALPEVAGLLPDPIALPGGVK
ncbi:MAG: ABC transporter ATP-binding protein, partial [Myxococcales bacterium]|nr:ABC transporter ATP-binding protein [Myxococcales bacterium]